jgi:hypothetical protein
MEMTYAKYLGNVVRGDTSIQDIFSSKNLSEGCTTKEHSHRGKEETGDEQEIGLTGNHQDKQCINHKKEGRGF